MAKQNQSNTSLDVNTLVAVILEAQRVSLVTTFATLGITQIQAHPSAVPNPAQISAQSIVANQAQSAPVPAMPLQAQPLQFAPIAPIPAQAQGSQGTKRTGSKRKGKGTGNGHHKTLLAPNFGDFHCQIGANRTKLPLGIFRDDNGNLFDNIHLRLPNGQYHTLKTDVEGRGRLTLKQTDALNAFENQDHMLVFSRDTQYANVWDVQVVRGIRDTSQTATHTQKAQTQQVYASAQDAFRQDAKAFAPTAPSVPSGKKQRTPAQQANDKRLGELAKARHAAQSQGTASAPRPVAPVQTAMPFVRVTDELVRVTDEDAFSAAFEKPIPARGFDYVRPQTRR